MNREKVVVSAERSAAEGRSPRGACPYHLRLERALARVEAKLDRLADDLRELKRDERDLAARNGARGEQLARLDVKVAALAGGIALAGTALANWLFRLIK